MFNCNEYIFQMCVNLDFLHCCVAWVSISAQGSQIPCLDNVESNERERNSLEFLIYLKNPIQYPKKFAAFRIGGEILITETFSSLCELPGELPLAIDGSCKACELPME